MLALLPLPATGSVLDKICSVDFAGVAVFPCMISRIAPLLSTFYLLAARFASLSSSVPGFRIPRSRQTSTRDDGEQRQGISAQQLSLLVSPHSCSSSSAPRSSPERHRRSSRLSPATAEAAHLSNRPHSISSDESSRRLSRQQELWQHQQQRSQRSHLYVPLSSLRAQAANPLAAGTPGSTSSSQSFGGGVPRIIVVGAPFAGRSFGGGSRPFIGGGLAFGAGYGAFRYGRVGGRGFPFGYWPLYYGVNYYDNDEVCISCTGVETELTSIAVRPLGQLLATRRTPRRLLDRKRHV